MSVVLVFPGQGSQKNGMARDFCEQFPAARAVFDEASDALGLDLGALCWGDDPRLGLTAFTQPAILTAEIAMLRATDALGAPAADWYAGHSLGEYTALVAAGVIPLAEAVRLVHARGQRMQDAVPAGEGAMAAVIRKDLDPDALRGALDGLAVDVANHNAPDQIVISGSAPHIDAAMARLGDAPAAAGARFKKLDVSAPFHSRLMAPIEPGFRALLAASAPTWDLTRAGHVASNFTGGLHTPDADAVIDALTRQISGSVRWVDNMRALLALSPTRVIEVGPNRPLRSFFRALGAEVDAIFNLVTARRVLGID